MPSDTTKQASNSSTDQGGREAAGQNTVKALSRGLTIVAFLREISSPESRSPLDLEGRHFGGLLFVTAQYSPRVTALCLRLLI
jgi:hypothetical protein